jgi:hypothetical protein
MGTANGGEARPADDVFECRRVVRRTSRACNLALWSRMQRKRGRMLHARARLVRDERAKTCTDQAIMRLNLHANDVTAACCCWVRKQVCSVKLKTQVVIVE